MSRVPRSGHIPRSSVAAFAQKYETISTMRREPYPAARAVSPRLHAYFAGQAEGGHGHGARAAIPDRHSIEQIIDAAFWASLRREEGVTPRISLAFLAPDDAAHAFRFERPLPAEPGVLTRVAPAVERSGIHLAVWHGLGEGLHVWGAVRGIPKFCFVVEVAAPGLIVVKNYTGDISGKFVNVAVLEGDLIKIVNQGRAAAPESVHRLRPLLGFDGPESWVHSGSLLAQLAVSMRSHGHGGSLLVVPSASDAWRESIVPPITYALSPPFGGLAGIHRAEPEKARRMIDATAGLTAVDGAVLLTDQYEILGFGAKIVRRKSYPQVEQIRVTEPIEGARPALVHPDHLGGTRHLSAAQFVHDQREAAALVASQDRRFTIFEWSPADEMVHAHRIEALLL